MSLLEGEDLRVAATSAGQEPVAGLLGYRLPVKDSLAGLAVRSGQAYQCLDAARDGRADQEFVRLSGLRSFLSVPCSLNSGPSVHSWWEIANPALSVWTTSDC